MKCLALALLLVPAAAWGAKVATQYDSFTLPTDANVQMCVAENDRCGVPKPVKAGAFTNCGDWIFPVAAGVTSAPYPPPAGYQRLGCFTVSAAPTPAPAPAPVSVVKAPPCYYDDALPAKRGRFFTDAAGAEITETAAELKLFMPVIQKSIFGAIYWLCGDASPHAVYGRGDEVAAFLMFVAPVWYTLLDKAQKDALFLKQFPPCSVGAECLDYGPQATLARAKLAALNPVTPPIVAGPVYAVTPSTTAAIDAPVYRLKADGTRNTTAVSGKRAARGVACDPSKRYMLTGYYAVPSLKDAIGDVYASCAPVR